MSKSLDELEDQFRRDIDDKAEPYLWTQEEFHEYMDEAQDEFVEQVDAIADEIELPYTAGDLFIEDPSYITRIRQVVSAAKKDIPLYNAEQWREVQITDDYGASSLSNSWESKTGPEPRALITDIKINEIRLYPIPEADGTLTLQVYRRPLESLTDAGELEIFDPQYQRCIMLKVMSLAYNKHDAETFKPQAASDFDHRFGQSVDRIKVRIKRRTRRARSVAHTGGGYGS